MQFDDASCAIRMAANPNVGKRNETYTKQVNFVATRNANDKNACSFMLLLLLPLFYDVFSVVRCSSSVHVLFAVFPRIPFTIFPFR